MNDVLFYVVSFLLQFAAFLFVVRFLLQVCRVDFYNPVSQGIVKATDLVLKPVRMILPGYGNIDFAALVAALAANTLLIVAAGAITNQYMGSITEILTGGTAPAEAEPVVEEAPEVEVAEVETPEVEAPEVETAEVETAASEAAVEAESAPAEQSAAEEDAAKKNEE